MVGMDTGFRHDAAWKNVTGGATEGVPRRRLPPTVGLTFEVRFPDWPETPRLAQANSESSYSDRFYRSDRRLWLQPLPPPGPFEFVVEWRSVGINATSGAVDGAAIARAAECAEPYWP